MQMMLATDRGIEPHSRTRTICFRNNAPHRQGLSVILGAETRVELVIFGL